MSSFSHDILIVGGFGHVGLPLGIVLADAGFRVLLYDIDTSKKQMILDGKMPFIEYGAEEILPRVIGKNLFIADDLSEVQNAETIIVTIGTPLDEYLNPKLSPILRLIENLAPHLTEKHLVVLRSTIFPGTMQQLHNVFEKRGIKAALAYCPERIVQAYAVQELRKLPQVVAGFGDMAIARASAVFTRLGVETVTVEPVEAELTKIFLNAWRYIHFATANQFYMIAEQCGADFSRIHHAMTYKYDRAKTFPKPGFAAGPCLMKDTMQLAAFSQNNFPLGHASMLVNEGLPAFVVQGLLKEFDLSKETVGILGMAFKADCDDIRDSLSYKVGKLLRFHGANVLYSDEFAKDPTFIAKEELVKKSSIIILGVPHTAYKTLAIPPAKHVVDVWGVFPKKA